MTTTEPRMLASVSATMRYADAILRCRVCHGLGECPHRYSKEELAELDTSAKWNEVFGNTHYAERDGCDCPPGCCEHGHDPDNCTC